jgi:hypothetical protein
MVGHLAARLDVEDEVVRRPLDPLLSDGGRGEGVERRVDLDGVEACRVVAKAFLRRGDALRVPGLDEALVGPAARAESDGGGHVATIDRWRAAAAAEGGRLENSNHNER